MMSDLFLDETEIYDKTSKVYSTQCGDSYNPFTYREDPFLYQGAEVISTKSSDLKVYISSYGVMGIDDNLQGHSYFQTMISQMTPYKDLKHIGYSDDSLVFKITTNGSKKKEP
jgi:hypothetical protein